MEKLKEKIDVAIKRKKDLRDALVERDKRIEELLRECNFYRSQAEKVEGLIDENVKLSNKLEKMEASIEEVTRKVESGFAD